jgi:hypothetical protein
LECDEDNDNEDLVDWHYDEMDHRHIFTKKSGEVYKKSKSKPLTEKEKKIWNIKHNIIY